MIQRRHRLRFPLEAAPGDLLAADYDRYDAVYTRVSGTVNGPHGSGTDLAEDFVRSEAGTCLKTLRYWPRRRDRDGSIAASQQGLDFAAHVFVRTGLSHKSRAVIGWRGTLRAEA